MLDATRCRSCGRTAAIRTRICPTCGSRGGDDVELIGDGTVYAHTTIEVGPVEFRDLVPYQVVLVDVGDVRVEGRMIPGSEPVQVGTQVHLAELDDGVPLFRAS